MPNIRLDNNPHIRVSKNESTKRNQLNLKELHSTGKKTGAWREPKKYGSITRGVYRLVNNIQFGGINPITKVGTYNNLRQLVTQGRFLSNKERTIAKYEEQITNKINSIFKREDNSTNTEHFGKIIRSSYGSYHPTEKKDPGMRVGDKKKQINFSPLDNDWMKGKKASDNYQEFVFGFKVTENWVPKDYNRKGLINAETKEEAKTILAEGDKEIFNLTGTENTDLKKELNNIVDPNNGKTDEEAMEELKGALDKYHGTMITQMENTLFDPEGNPPPSTNSYLGKVRKLLIGKQKDRI